MHFISNIQFNYILVVPIFYLFGCELLNYAFAVNTEACCCCWSEFCLFRSSKAVSKILNPGLISLSGTEIANKYDLFFDFPQDFKHSMAMQRRIERIIVVTIKFPFENVIKEIFHFIINSMLLPSPILILRIERHLQKQQDLLRMGRVLIHPLSLY
jgi:hypothetical protein